MLSDFFYDEPSVYMYSVSRHKRLIQLIIKHPGLTLKELRKLNGKGEPLGPDIHLKLDFLSLTGDLRCDNGKWYAVAPSHDYEGM